MTRPLLEDTLQHLNSHHLSKVCERHHLPSQPLHEKTLRDQLIKAFRQPETFQRLLTTLTPFEHQLLWYVKSKGGTVNGWELVAYALCISEGPPSCTPVHLFTEGLRAIEASTYLYPLFQDLLIVPFDRHSNWLQGKTSELDDYRVKADPRILELLPPPPPVDPLTYPVETVLQHTPARHPLHPLVQLTHLWMHLHHAGPTRITQQGQYPKNTIGTLEDHLKLNPSQVEVLLNTMVHLGLLKVEGQHINVALERFRTHLRKPLEDQYRDVVGGYLKLYGGDVRLVPYTWIIIQALTLLPGPVELQAGLTQLEEGFLGAFLVSANGKNHFEYPMQTQQITDTHWSHLQLLGLVELDVAQNTLAPTEGLQWLQPLTRLTPRPVPHSSSPSMVIQANFEVMVYLDLLNPEHLQALLCMRITHLDQQTLTAEITKTSFLQGLQVLGSFEEALGLLRHASMTPLSPNVTSTLHSWAQRKEGNVLRHNVTLLEFPSEQARDAYHKTLQGEAQKVGQTCLLVPTPPHLPQAWTVLDYQQPLPPHPMVLTEHGDIQVRGPRDLITQALIQRFLQETGPGTYRFRTEALQDASLTPTQRERFEERLGGRLPPYIQALADIHAGTTQPPMWAEAILFSHPRAQQLAEHPSLRPYLQNPYTPTTYLVPKHHQHPLDQALRDLGLPTTPQLEDARGALQTNLPPRTLRDLLQVAIDHQRVVEVTYEHVYSPADIHREWLQPVELYQKHQQWHLVARTLDGHHEHTVPLRDIQGIRMH